MSFYRRVMLWDYTAFTMMVIDTIVHFFPLSSATIEEDDRVSCVLTFKGQEYKGVGRNKRNAKLSASYKALKKN